MAAKIVWVLFGIIAVLSCTYSVCYSSSVPLLVWSSKSLDVEDEVLAGHTLSFEDVQKQYLDKLAVQSNTICLFIQDKLNLDDFVVHESDFKNLNQILSSSSSTTVLPSVKSQHDNDQSDNSFVQYFQKHVNGKQIVSVYPTDVADFPNKIKKLNPDNLNVFIVYLPKSSAPEGKSSFEASDKIIEEISKEVKKHFPDFIGLLTAQMPSEVGKSQNDVVTTSHVRSRREASFVGDSSCTIPGILVTGSRNRILYLSSISFGNQNYSDQFKSNYSILDHRMDESTNNSIKFTFPPDSFVNGSDITLSFTFNQTENGHLWSCHNIVVSGKIGDHSVDEAFDCSSPINQIRAHMAFPNRNSFACNDYKINGTFLMKISGLQLQLGGNRNGTFLDSVNCVGFFTTPIWMGLLTVAVLIAILYVGLLGLLSIRSMDRFDNPKDPTITINTD